MKKQKLRFNDTVYVKDFDGQFKVMRVYNYTVDLFGPFGVTEYGTLVSHNTCGIVSRDLVTLHV